MPIPSHEELHAQAVALWRSMEANDPAAIIYADAVTTLFTGGPVTQRRATKWITTLHRYEDHWRGTGHAPRENTPDRSTLSDEERNLGEWARYQRRFEDQLNGYQRARLDVSPAFEWDPLETLWQGRFLACVAFVQTNGRLPRLHAEDRNEFALARWLGRQLLRLREGRLDQKRARELHHLIRISRRR